MYSAYKLNKQGDNIQHMYVCMGMYIYICMCVCVLDKTSESPLDSEEIKPVNLEGNKS